MTFVCFSDEIVDFISRQRHYEIIDQNIVFSDQKFSSVLRLVRGIQLRHSFHR